MKYSDFTCEEVVAMLKAKQGTKSLRKFAAELIVSPSFLSEVYRGTRNPGPYLAKLLGLEQMPKEKWNPVYRPTKEQQLKINRLHSEQRR